MKFKEFESKRRFAETQSGRIAYVENGAGPVAVFLHGVLVNGYLWRHQLDGVAGERRCIAIDLMAHGASEIIPAQDVSFRAQAVMVGQVLDALHIDQIDLVANDSGVGIAQIFAGNAPERLRSLALTNGDVHDNWPPKEFSGFLEMVAQGGPEETLGRMLADKNYFRSAEALGPAYERPEDVTDETIEAYLRPFLSEKQHVRDLERFILAFDNGQTVQMEPRLKALHVPTLILWGTGDIFFNVKWSRWLAETIPGTTRRAELEDARLLFPEERARELNEALLAHWRQAGNLNLKASNG
jgi:pimeloyl-ACP methyl ester carboxylesterase